MRGAKIQHGHTAGGKSSVEYCAWCAMQARCNNPKDKYYGGAGITVCPEWLGRGGFARFLADMGPRPDGAKLYRKDGSKGYTKENCIWSAELPSYRKWKGRLITVNGESHTVKEWAELTNQNRFTIYARLEYGWPPHEAIYGRKKSAQKTEGQSAA